MYNFENKKIKGKILDLKQIAKDVIELEIKELKKVKENLDENFEKTVKTIYETKGRTIIIGMGKSGLIGQKIAATLASTGTISYFIHPCEAYHGDLGNIHPDDVVILLSFSGETQEVVSLLKFLNRQGNKLISITGNKNSTLAKNTHHHIEVSIENEACPLKLAPTSSTTATLVIGDAIAIALMQMKGICERDFAKYHPGGSLGKKLYNKN